MSNRTYLCGTCGSLRRAPACYTGRKHSLEETMASRYWPGHCARPMVVLSFIQGVAATRVPASRRVVWARNGLHVLRRPGKRQWVPAVNERQVRDAEEQLAEYGIRLWDGIKAKVPDAWRRRKALLRLSPRA